LNIQTHKKNMKKYLIPALACIVFAALAMSFSGSGVVENKGIAVVDQNGAVLNEADYGGLTSNLLYRTFTKDTITNAANDTLLIGPTTTTYYDLQSRYVCGVYLTRTNISGTTALTVTIQANGLSSSGTGDWSTVATSAATTATNEQLAVAECYGRRLRVIIDGSGTQSSSYQVNFVLKRFQ